MILNRYGVRWEGWVAYMGKNEHMEDWSKGKENESAYEANTCTGMYRNSLFFT